MSAESPDPVVHLELHTGDLPGACGFYSRLFGWRTERLETARGDYTALGLGRSIQGGAVECGAGRGLWLPYVEVPDVGAATERARALGASVRLETREGPAGWRSVIASPDGAEIALWEPKS